MLEPRRLAARAAARRMAAERGCDLGSEIGYQVRFDRRAGRETRILVVTEGIFVQMLQRDPFLEGVGVVIFDEFHERNLDSDLALAMVRRVQNEARSDLRIVVMSATLDPEPIATFLGSCPAVESEGRLFPVEIRNLDRPDPRPIEAVVAAGVRQALTARSGDVLVFLPGIVEIRRTTELLETLAKEQNFRLLQLYGDLPAEQQDSVLKSGSRRKVVLATNVAETSITIDGISAVVDSGWARTLRFDPSTGLDRLELGRISRDAADQRAGRAGRQGPGLCLRRWTDHDDRSLKEQKTPEIRRIDLAAPSLQLMTWGESDLRHFEWFEPPRPGALDRASALLADLGAINSTGPTETGRAMAGLPVHPRLARLLIAGHRGGETRRAALCAALLSERDLIHRSGKQPSVATTSGPSDLLDRLEALEQFAATGFGETAVGPVHRGRGHHLLRVGRQLEQLAKRLSVAAPKRPDEATRDGDEVLLRALLAAYPDRVARRRKGDPTRGVMVGGRGIRLAPSSCVRDGELLLCLDLDARGREALVRQASRIETTWLARETIQTSIEVSFDNERNRVVGQCITRYRDLVLETLDCDPARLSDVKDKIEERLAAAAAANLAEALNLESPDLASFLARTRSLSEWMPESGLPSLSQDDLRALLPQLVIGKRSFAELQRAPLLEILKGVVGFEACRKLDQFAPERLEVPSGSWIRLRYDPGQPPILAVRIQELFGLEDTPSVAGGKIPVMLHLLAPNQRPQQVTRDLASFWQNTYPQVRKELRARYPRHAWPEDPLTAQPERRPSRRR